MDGLPGVSDYGNTPDEAMVKAEALALRVLAEKLEEEESFPQSITISYLFLMLPHEPMVISESQSSSCRVDWY